MTYSIQERGPGRWVAKADGKIIGLSPDRAVVVQMIERHKTALCEPVSYEEVVR